jgi:ABC-2 type transport system ATP-binding protein
MASTGPALALVDVVKRYAGRTVLSGVSLAVQPGELVALLGPNGAGKTTAVEILEGYRTADAGQATLLGLDPRRGGPALRARLGHMLQGGGLDQRSTPRELLRLYAAFHAGARDPDSLLVEVGLNGVAATRVRHLSGGERQRLALALALVGEPEALILDEPTAGMDPEARRATRTLIGELRGRGLAILMTTHDLGDVERLADRVVILHHGHVVADGPPGAVGATGEPVLRFRLERALDAGERAGVVAALRTSSPRAGAPTAQPRDGTPAEASAGGTLAEVPAHGMGWYRLDGLDPSPALIASLAAWCAETDVRILELRTSGDTLEERYLALTGDHDVEALA